MSVLPARALGWLMPAVSRRAERQVRACLAVDERTSREIVDGSFAHFGETFWRWLRSRARGPLGGVTVRCDSASLAALDADRSRGRGLVMASAHLGDWELLSCFLARQGHAVNVVSTTLLHPWLDAYLVAWRRRQGVATITRGRPQALSAIHRVFARGEGLGFLIDQDTAARSIEVPFFGHPARVPVGPIRLALRRRTPVWLGCAIRVAPGAYRVDVEQVAPTRSGDLGADTRRLATEITRRVEQLVRAWPDQWLWQLERWKRIEGPC